MAINNLNPRRVVWFSPNEPSNKYDIWLSRNAHYDENGEPTTDSNSQRGCDYIFKIYDCGRWVPIVGFNSTAANKIDTVTGVDYTIDGVTHSGKEVYHPAIFTNESPNELYDAGTLGSLLSDQHFVSEQEWYDVFNSTDYSWDNIFGDTNWFGDLTWSIILSGSSNYHLPWATTTQCGGILSATHPVASSAFKPIEVKFYPNVPGYYQDEQHRLCVSAKDVIDLIDEYYQDNPDPNNPVQIPIGGTFENTSSIGSSLLHTNANPNALKAQIYNVNSGNAGKFLRVKPLSEWPNIPSGQDAPSGGWNQTNCLVEWVDSPNTWRPILISNNPIEDNHLNIVAGLNITITPTINLGVTTATISANLTPSPITITEGDGIDVDHTGSNYKVGINTLGASLGQVLSYDATLDKVKWETLSPGTLYTEGDGIDITNGEISIDTNGVTQGYVLSCGALGVAWVPQAGSYTAGTGVLIDQNVIKSEVLVDNTSHTANMSIAFECAGESNNGYIKAGIDILGNSSQINILPFNYTLIESGNTAISVSFTVDDQKTYMKGDPVFVELNLRKTLSAGATASITFGENAKWIDEGASIQVSGNTGTFKNPHVLVTIQFGIVKIEPIEDYIRQP